MVVKFLIISLSLLLVSSESNSEAKGDSNLLNNPSLTNCLTDALVLETILLRISVELSSGIFIPVALKEIKFFWSLLPEWFQVCKGIIKSPEGLQGAFSDIEIEYTSEGLLIDGKLYTPNDILEDFNFESCIQAVEIAAQRFSEIKAKLDEKAYQEAIDLLFSISKLVESLDEVC